MDMTDAIWEAVRTLVLVAFFVILAMNTGRGKLPGWLRTLTMYVSVVMAALLALSIPMLLTGYMPTEVQHDAISSVQALIGSSFIFYTIWFKWPQPKPAPNSPDA